MTREELDLKLGGIESMLSLTDTGAAAVIVAARDALAQQSDVQGEYICKCGVRVEPHRCSTGTEF